MFDDQQACQDDTNNNSKDGNDTLYNKENQTYAKKEGF